MPKMKTKSSVAKRFKTTGKKKIKRNHAFGNHLAGSKSSRQKRKYRKSAIMAQGDVKRLKRLLPTK